MGLWAVGRDFQNARRQFYGQPGTFRPTPYGFEYRTLSNFWAHDTDLIYEIGHQATLLANFLERDATVIRESMLSINWQQVRTLIADNSQGRDAWNLHGKLMRMLS